MPQKAHHTTDFNQRKKFTLIGLIVRVANTYRTHHLSRSAAAVSYYLLLALFPMVVCFSVLLYQSMTLPGTIGSEAAAWLTELLDGIGGFSWENPDGISSTVIFTAALTLLLSASAGAYRCLSVSASEIASDRSPAISHTKHNTGIFGFLIGYLFATVLVFAVYAAIFLLLLWEELTALIAHRLPANAITDLLSASRYLVLFLLFFALCYALMRILPPHLQNTDKNARSRRTATAPGALFCTIGLCAATFWFALFIRGSTRYSLVYGSLASMILFLTWIFVCGNLLLLGIAVNAAADAVS